MFAILALLAWVLALFDVHIGRIDFVVLGLCFLALHLSLDGWAPWRRTPR
jgi:hypothetical protein